ncbi:MAG TPA: helix-turn-helix transcriptional regulator, partial [Anaerolineales bacterium]|nr:helix-turn-helix transcriptional regulator [Anaerolineales bacterium]
MDYSFGKWVRHRRKSLDLTQGELAGRVGCSASLIFKIEADERRPSRQIAELLVEQLDSPPTQRDLFLRVARQEKTADHLDLLMLPSTSVPVSPTYQ